MAPIITGIRRLSITHRTTYQYEGEITESHNLLRLVPRSDRRQRVENFDLTITPTVSVRPFEDPFGNYALEANIFEPHDMLVIESKSEVAIDDCDPFARLPDDGGIFFPIAWSSFESHVLEPYRTASLEPGKNWEDLAEHARLAAVNNNHNVTETLFALNLQIYREFEYKQGVTTPETSVFEVFRSRQGVCQDFATLYIAWARALGLPSRYVWGYLLMDVIDPARQTEEATHAWVEVYIPKVGWMGFDPTNGVLADKRYVAVAHSRSPREAPPISGTVTPAQSQTVTVQVRVTDLSAENTLQPAAPVENVGAPST